MFIVEKKISAKWQFKPHHDQECFFEQETLPLLYP